ncbi:unnamed protein product [Dibothriocephalus latus]|uniref:Receptor ligand binding region domain-containing protein n=1 Tax=Dibothriocephalus latus TaxID=60516 RepID=A0A3P7NUE6_DIBLA|nr:unnamed protein product [Dibothriocephalus latus]
MEDTHLALEDTHLAVRLEPLTWHVARALVDFLQAFSWNIALVVYNTNVPGSQLLVNELKYLQEERDIQDHPNHFQYVCFSSSHITFFMRKFSPNF